MSPKQSPLPLVELVVRSKKIGADQSLVVYGGGNTSSKGEILDHLGRTHQVMWVKGSGSDMMYGGERDYPALYLDDLRQLISFDDLLARTVVLNNVKKSCF